MTPPDSPGAARRMLVKKNSVAEGLISDRDIYAIPSQVIHLAYDQGCINSKKTPLYFMSNSQIKI